MRKCCSNVLMKQFVSDKNPDFTYIKISSSLTVPFIKMANNVCAAFAILYRDSYTKVRFSRSNCSRTRSGNVYFTFLIRLSHLHAKEHKKGHKNLPKES